VDVVETKSDSGSITSTGVSTRQETEPDAEGLDGTPAAGMPQTQATPGESGGVLERFFTGNGAIDVRGGIAGYMLLDPSIAGGLVVTESGGPPSVQAEGFKNLYGPWVRASWFPNETVGIGVEAAFIESDEQFTVEDTLYRSQAELQFFQAVALVRLVGSEYPATLTMALGGGAALIELQQSTESVASTYSSVVDILGVIGTSVDMSIPIVRFVHVTGGLSYLFVPFTTLTLSDNDGTYARTYHEGNLGGLEIRLGVVLEL
jgi:hypothetical protein